MALKSLGWWWQGRTLVPLTGLMVLGLLFLLMFIAMGMSYFGGTFRDPLRSEPLYTWRHTWHDPVAAAAAVYRGAAVLVSLAPGTDPADPAEWKPALVLQAGRTQRAMRRAPCARDAVLASDGAVPHAGGTQHAGRHSRVPYPSH
jgi:hypothetical protein